MPGRTRKPEKKQTDQCDHRESSRTNNPLVGLVTPETDRDAGKKTCAYDPPYGVKYGSNFQPFVNRLDVKDGNGRGSDAGAGDDQGVFGIRGNSGFIRTCHTCGIGCCWHGGVFVQISDENVHLVRCLMDEVFWGGEL